MAWLPSFRGVIDRRILVNFRIEPDALAGVLPDPFEPRTIDGVAIGGVCCLRLADVRPRGLPAALGIGAESAAHRIGVAWDDGVERRATRSARPPRSTAHGSGDRRQGVYVPRRDTSSRLVAAVGDRTFGRHERAAFDVTEGNGRYELTMQSHNDGTSIHVAGHVTDTLPEGSVFPDVEAATDYHQCGIEGYSPSPDGARLDCLAMQVDDWAVKPLAVDEVRASFFEDRLPADAVTFDNALLMADVGVDLGQRTPISSARA